ncbi:MAG: primosomal protein N', partial [Limnohabitans sp.]
MTTDCWVDVAVQTPAHSAVGGLLTYRCVQPVQAGHLVRVPLGRTQLLGVVWAVNKQPPQALKADAVRDVLEVLDAVDPLSTRWGPRVDVGGRDYQRAGGGVARSAVRPGRRARDRTARA